MSETTNAVGMLPTGNSPVTSVRKFSFTATFGAITPLNGTEVTQSVPGLLVGDVVQVICTSTPTVGMIIANARVSATDTLSILFSTSVAIGITMGSLNFVGVAFR